MLAGLIYAKMMELGIRTEAELARRTGLSPSQVTRLLSGRIRDVPSLTLIALDQHLGLDPRDVAYAAAGMRRNGGDQRHPGIAALLAKWRAGRVYLTEAEVANLMRYDGAECATAEAAMLQVCTWRVWHLQRAVGEE